MSQWRRSETAVQRFPRIAARVPVRISTVEPERDPDTGAAFFRSAVETTANLSRGGAFVESWEPLDAGRGVVVSVDLPDGRELQLVGRVAWTRRQLRPASDAALVAPGYGIEFTGGSSHELSALDAYLNRVAASRPSTSGPQRDPAPQPSIP